MSNLGYLKQIQLQTRTKSQATGHLKTAANTILYPCALGPNGQTVFKKEGDGKTPQGIWYPLYLYYRPDRGKRPQTGLPIKPLQKHFGWCDAVGDRNYNRPINLPYPRSTENLWREDAAYDLIVVLNHNQSPRVQGRGSAIFIHIAKPGLPPTEGCIALKKNDLLLLLPQITRTTKIII